MSKATVRKVFVMGLVLWVVGGVLAALTMQGGQSPHPAVYSAGLALVAVGALVEVVSWILALISVALLGRWGWFLAMLILAPLGLLLIVMIIYSFFGPSLPRAARRRQLSAG